MSAVTPFTLTPFETILFQLDPKKAKEQGFSQRISQLDQVSFNRLKRQYSKQYSQAISSIKDLMATFILSPIEQDQIRLLLKFKVSDASMAPQGALIRKFRQILRSVSPIKKRDTGWIDDAKKLQMRLARLDPSLPLSGQVSISAPQELPNPMNRVPIEIWKTIFSLVPGRDLKNIAMTCSQFYQASSDQALWGALFNEEWAPLKSANLLKEIAKRNIGRDSWGQLAHFIIEAANSVCLTDELLISLGDKKWTVRDRWTGEKISTYPHKGTMSVFRVVPGCEYIGLMGESNERLLIRSKDFAVKSESLPKPCFRIPSQASYQTVFFEGEGNVCLYQEGLLIKKVAEGDNQEHRLIFTLPAQESKNGRFTEDGEFFIALGSEAINSYNLKTGVVHSLRFNPGEKFNYLPDTFQVVTDTRRWSLPLGEELPFKEEKNQEEKHPKFGIPLGNIFEKLTPFLLEPEHIFKIDLHHFSPDGCTLLVYEALKEAPMNRLAYHVIHLTPPPPK